MQALIVFAFQLIVLIASVMVHEIAHGVVALRLGDRTAKDAGRLTLNPLRHIDPIGSILLPLIMAIPWIFGGTPGPIFGWAKPVPINTRNLANPTVGTGLIAAAGPLSNFSIAVCFGILTRLLGGGTLTALFSLVVLINLALGLFNLIPIPPLDGSNVLFAFLPTRFAWLRDVLARYGLFILLGYILIGAPLLGDIIIFLYHIVAGSPLM